MATHKLIACLALGCLLAPATAQVPNGGFETWITPPGATYQDPSGWITTNVLASFGGTASCTQGSPGAEGSHYAMVATVEVMGNMLPGILVSGDGVTGQAGFPFTGQPANFTGQYQYGISDGDEGYTSVVLSKWNTATQSRDVLGTGLLPITGTMSAWTTLNVPITYVSAEVPDTATITITCSMGAPGAGSFINVDDLGFNGSSGVMDIAPKAEVRMFPSPATNVLYVESDRQIAELGVLDITGRTLLDRNVHAKQYALDLGEIHTGRYLVQLRMADGTRQVRSFVKE